MPGSTAAAVAAAIVLHSYPHDPSAFTQGLEYRKGALYESTGLTGHSSLRRVELETGRVLQLIPLSSDYFGEGITVLGDRILQLTWISHLGFIYDRSTLARMGTFSYEGEGWGLTSSDSIVYLSDGSSEIRCLDSRSLRERRRITVRDGARIVDQLNELEWVKGSLYANVWHSDLIARINPTSGVVEGWIDVAALHKDSGADDAEAVPNGIAYDAEHDRLFVTGKLWRKLFQIAVPASSTAR